MVFNFDARPILEEKISGVGEYTKQVLDAFSRRKDFETIVFTNSFLKPQSLRKRVPQCLRPKHSHFRFPNKLLNFSTWLFGLPKFDWLIGNKQPFFFPNISFFALSHKVKHAIVIHDLSFERFPENLDLQKRIWHYFLNPRSLARKADLLVAVSESTKNDLVDLYGIDSEKIQVAYHGVSSFFRVIDKSDKGFALVRKKYNLPNKFILSLATIEPRKNFKALISAFLKLKEEGKFSELSLVIAGNPGWKCDEVQKKMSIGTGRDSIKFIGYIADADRAFLYNLAEIFVYPSHFEGFGLPVLEAMACACPVITSNGSSLPEVGGDAVIPVDTEKPREIAEALGCLLENDKFMDKMKQATLERSKGFTWDKCSQITLNAFFNL